jgi:hypothetical protein
LFLLAAAPPPLDASSSLMRKNRRKISVATAAAGSHHFVLNDDLETDVDLSINSLGRRYLQEEEFDVQGADDQLGNSRIEESGESFTLTLTPGRESKWRQREETANDDNGQQRSGDNFVVQPLAPSSERHDHDAMDSEPQQLIVDTQEVGQTAEILRAADESLSYENSMQGVDERAAIRQQPQQPPPQQYQENEKKQGGRLTQTWTKEMPIPRTNMQTASNQLSVGSQNTVLSEFRRGEGQKRVVELQQKEMPLTASPRIIEEERPQPMHYGHQQQSISEEEDAIEAHKSFFTMPSSQQLPDAVKNTIIAMQKLDVKENKKKGHHYNELMEQKHREYEKRQQKLAENNPSNIVRPPPKTFIIDDPVNAQKFADFIARKKEKIDRKEKIRHPIQSILGGGNSSNQSIRTKNQSPMNKYKAKIKQHIASASSSNIQPNQKKPDLRPEAQPKKRVGENVLRQIPIVKRAFKRTKSFETLNDAALSFTRSLLMGVFKNNNNVMDLKRKAALLDWLDLLSVALPPEIGLHELVDTLKNNIDNIAQTPSSLKAIIDKHPIPDSEYSESCTKKIEGTGFFCGFWKLLHVASVGFAEQQGGLVLRELHPNIRLFSAKEAGEVLREYMGLFFNCDKCSKRFIANYDECALERCHRLTDEIIDASEESWREFPIWIWEVHNDISRSKAQRASDFQEKQNRRADVKKWETYMGAVYPHIDQCVQCWTAEGTWDVNAVYNHLEREYW